MKSTQTNAEAGTAEDSSNYFEAVVVSIDSEDIEQAGYDVSALDAETFSRIKNRIWGILCGESFLDVISEACDDLLPKK